MLAQKLVATFHLMDLNQFYTLLFCLWFLLLGVIEYFIFALHLAALVLAGRLGPQNPASLMRPAMVFFAISAWRLAERPGENTRKGLLRIESVL